MRCNLLYYNNGNVTCNTRLHLLQLQLTSSTIRNYEINMQNTTRQDTDNKRHLRDGPEAQTHTHISVELSSQSFIVCVTEEACITQLVPSLSPSLHSRGGWPWTHSASSSSPSRWLVSSSSSGSFTKAVPGRPRASAPASSASATSRRWNGTQGDLRDLSETTMSLGRGCGVGVGGHEGPDPFLSALSWCAATPVGLVWVPLSQTTSM